MLDFKPSHFLLHSISKLVRRLLFIYDEVQECTTTRKYTLIDQEKGIRFILTAVVIFSIYSISDLQYGSAQIENWKRYSDPGRKFTFIHPPNWVVNTRHLDGGFTEVTLTNPNSTRMKISIMYTPKDSLLDSESGRSVITSRALTNLEEDISVDYIFFNSTGKFPHKYVIPGHESASDLIDFEKIKGQPGRMLIVYSKITDTDSLTISYSESKRMFYKSLSDVSQIIKSVTI